MKKLFIPDDVEGYDQLWFIGDSFVATTYREFFKNDLNYDFFTKRNFDVSAYCNSKQSEKDQNIVRRLRNSLAVALTKNWKLPKYIVVILEGDIIDYLNYTNFGISGFYGDLLESVIKGFVAMIKTRKDQLPQKSKKATYPFIYWVAAPMHKI